MCAYEREGLCACACVKHTAKSQDTTRDKDEKDGGGWESSRHSSE